MKNNNKNKQPNPAFAGPIERESIVNNAETYHKVTCHTEIDFALKRETL